MILGLLKLWMSSKAPPMDMDPPLSCPMKPTMICRILRLTTFNFSSSICQQVGF